MTMWMGIVLAVLAGLVLGACDDVTAVEEQTSRDIVFTPSVITDAWTISRDTVEGTYSGRRPDFAFGARGRILSTVFDNPGEIRIYNADREVVETAQYETDAGSQIMQSFAFDGEFVLIGYDRGAYHILIVDATLQELRRISFPYPYSEIVRLIELDSGEYVLLLADELRSSEGYSTTMSLLRISAQSGLMWTRSLADVMPERDLFLTDIASDGLGGFVAIGLLKDIWTESVLIGFEPTGAVAWQKEYSSRRYDKLTEIWHLDNGDYLLVGHNQGHGENHGWYVRVDATGDVIWDSERMWSEEHKEVSFVSQLRKNVNYIHSTASRLYVITLNAGIPPARTIELQADGTFLRQVIWPFQLRDGDVNCTVARVRPSSRGRLVALATCADHTRLGGTNFRTAMSTVFFTLE